MHRAIPLGSPKTLLSPGTLLAVAGVAALVGCAAGGEELPAAQTDAIVVGPPAPAACVASTVEQVETCAACCDRAHAEVKEILATAERCSADCAATGGILCYAPCQRASEAACRDAGGACDAYIACLGGCTANVPR